MNNSSKQYGIGIIGVRGYVGKELLKLIHNHPQLKLEWVSSRELCNQSVKVIVPQLEELVIKNLTPAQLVNIKTDIVILALPNGLSSPYVKAIEKNKSTQIVIDLSADYRFDKDWTYSLPELDSKKIKENSLATLLKISNPGCYATAMQLALAPIIDQIKPNASCFGISGYSGAGTTPNANNNHENLKDNILPYALVEHLHEKEVTARLHKIVSFSPHVAAFFRGINMTIQVAFETAITEEKLMNTFISYYQDAPLITCQKDIPNIQQVFKTTNCLIGGFKVSEDGKRATIVSCIDNLLKGAASQAMQNINIALGLKQTTGIEHMINLKETTELYLEQEK